MKIFFILCSLFTSIYALEIHSKYSVTFGIFGEIGVANAMLESNSTDYTITIEANSTAVARALSDNRRELYISRGRVVDGIYTPDLFRKVVTTNHSGDDSRFHFDYKKKRVTRIRDRYKIRTDYFTKREIIEKNHDEKEVEYFADNDLLTLFFNLQKWIENLKNESIQYAIGANDKDGRVDIKVLEKGEIAELRKRVGEGSKYLSVIINQKIFASKKGELFIVLDEERLAKKAILKDVIFFGDIIGEMVESKISR